MKKIPWLILTTGFSLSWAALAKIEIVNPWIHSAQEGGNALFNMHFEHGGKVELHASVRSK